MHRSIHYLNVASGRICCFPPSLFFLDQDLVSGLKARRQRKLGFDKLGGLGLSQFPARMGGVCSTRVMRSVEWL